MRLRIWVSSLFAATVLFGCVDAGSQTSAGSGAKSGGGDLVIATASFTGPPTGTGVVRMAPFGGMSGAMANAQFPTRLEVYLGSTAEADRLRAKGAPVYAYVKPIYVAVKQDNVDKTKDGVSGRIQLPTDNFCDGYRVVLSPANDYRLTQDFSFKFKIMEKSSAPFVRNDWEILDMQARAFVVRSGARPFRATAESRLYDPCTHPESKGQW